MTQPKFRMDAACYAQLMQGLNMQHFGEIKGDLSDFGLYHDDLWLSDTAVIENISRYQGQWAVHLTFAHVLQPLKFIRRYIVSLTCLKRATLHAQLIRRLAAKDQRGTLTVGAESFSLCHN